MSLNSGMHRFEWGISPLSWACSDVTLLRPERLLSEYWHCNEGAGLQRWRFGPRYRVSAQCIPLVKSFPGNPRLQKPFKGIMTQKRVQISCPTANTACINTVYSTY
eukprot:scpid104276/ scgid26266/ 